MAEEFNKDQEKEAKWYVIHTYSGYENKVKTDIEKTVANRSLNDGNEEGQPLSKEILEVRIPVEEVVEVKNGKQKVVEKKLYPCYAFVKMIMSEKNWYIIRNIRGVTGFVGAKASDPTPLTDEELVKMGILAKGEAKKIPVQVDFVVGDTVVITNPAWAGRKGKITGINMQKRTVSVSVNLGFSDITVEMDFTDVKKDKE